MVDYNIVSVYTSNTPGSYSFVRFGGYLQSDIEKGSELTLIRTKDIKSWAVELSGVELNYVAM